MERKRGWIKGLPLALAIAPFVAAYVFAQAPPPPTAPAPEPSESTQECLNCHAPEAETGPKVLFESLAASPHKDFDCRDCHAAFTPEAPHTEEMKQAMPACADCHPEASEAYQTSVHARRDKKAGDHPTCATCHGGGDPHAVHIRGTWTRPQKVEVCESCHRDMSRMSQYDKNVEAVDSYDHSFHGKALLRFGNLKTAICIDCHGNHGVLTHTDPKAATHPDNLIKTCAQSGCHPGATQSFAVSGANHMNMRIAQEPILSGILLFFVVLVVGMTSFLFIGVVLDLRTTVFGKKEPPCGRLVGALLSFGFLPIVIAIYQSLLQAGNPFATAGVGAALLVTAVGVHALRQRKARAEGEVVLFDRMSLSHRIQHAMLIVCFVALILTGLPVRQSDDSVFRAFYGFIGGMEVARWVHRVAGVGLILVFLIHVTELLIRWARHGFGFKSWSMLPTKQDIEHFVHLSRHYLGLEEEPPKYGKYSFRSKLDYLAEYWGVPLMGITGLILWFPVVFGRFLPPMAIPAAYIAHSYEAVLAFLAILTWHMYNASLNPRSFPMSRVWITGKITADELRHHHPLEYERLVREGEIPVSEPVPSEIGGEGEAPSAESALEPEGPASAEPPEDAAPPA